MTTHRDKFISGGPDGEAPTSLPRDVDRLVHKLRTPLNSLSLNADLLGSVSQPKPTKEALYARALKSLQTEVGRLDSIAGDFQRYVGASNPKWKDVSPAEILRTTVAGISKTTGREIDVGTAGLPPMIHADGHLVSEALAEVLENAIESRADGKVRIEVGVDDGSIFFDVSDQGPGLEFDPPERAFELFMGSKQGHIGFGLTYARRIARIHGGDVVVVRSTKEGATVRLVIPFK